MSDNRGLDDLRDNIANRYDHDMLLRGNIMALILILPLFAFIYSVCRIKDVHSQLTMFGNSESLMISAASMVAVTVEIMLVMLLIYITYIRLKSHSERDKDWRKAIIDFIGSMGLDNTKLRKINKKMNRVERTHAQLMTVVLIATYAILLIYVFGFAYTSNDAITTFFQEHVFTNGAENPLLAWTSENAAYMYLSILGVIMIFLEFLFVFRYVLKFPFAHEDRQIDFTMELNSQLNKIEMKCDVMIPSVKHHSVFIQLFLCVITAGMFTVIQLFSVYKSANDHLVNQWNYEENLLRQLSKAKKKSTNTMEQLAHRTVKKEATR